MTSLRPFRMALSALPSSRCTTRRACAPDGFAVRGAVGEVQETASNPFEGLRVDGRDKLSVGHAQVRGRSLCTLHTRHASVVAACKHLEHRLCRSVSGVCVGWLAQIGKDSVACRARGDAMVPARLAGDWRRRPLDVCR